MKLKIVFKTTVQSYFLIKIQIKLQINSEKFSKPVQNGLLIIHCLFICDTQNLKRKHRKVKDFHIICNDHTNDSTTSVKYLGLNIDNLLSGEIIENSIISKVNAHLKFLHRQSNSLSARTRKNLCSALILCHLMCYKRGNLI